MKIKWGVPIAVLIAQGAQETAWGRKVVQNAYFGIKGKSTSGGKLDRLARNVHFISGLMESGVEFIAVDMPQANKFTVHIMAAVAEQEAEAISKRTKAALQAAKARGTQLGGRKVSVERFAEIAETARKASAKVRTAKADGLKAGVLPIIEDIRNAGIVTLRGIAAELNTRGERTQRGMEWSSVQVMRVLQRI